MMRFRVAGHSMVPTLEPGKEVVTTSTRRAVPGDIVVFEHPSRPDFWLIKRLTDDRGWVLSDNEEDGTDDSRQFGPVDIARLNPVVNRLDAAIFDEASRFLAKEDEAFRELVDRWGIPEFWHRRPGFATLVLLIIEQQVSLDSGAAVFRRVQQMLGDVTPKNVIEAGEQALHEAGTTRQKAGYIVGLARAVDRGELDLDGLSDVDDLEARSSLKAIRGIGDWTADAYLLSADRRPDMWPVGDRALQVGTASVVGMQTIPDQEELEMLAEPWRPIRAVAARLIWHAYLSERGRVEPPDPTHGGDAGA